MRRRGILTLVGLAVLIAAAPAAARPAEPLPPVPEGQALYPETDPGAGLGGVAGATAVIRRLVEGRGVASGVGFRIDLHAGPGHKLVATRRGLRFRAVRIASIRFGENSARLRGTGVANGRSVAFTAVAVHNAVPDVDVFRIAWSHGASIGGRVVRGSVFIR